VLTLIPQLTDNVSIKIIDNNSEMPVSDILRDCLTDKIEIIRNHANVGLSGNIIKCFEYCDSEWMWLLSDDDIPAKDAIHNIISTLERHPDVSMIKYSSNAGRTDLNFQQEVVATGQKDFIAKINNFSNLLFISSTVCRVSKMREVTKDAYYFTQGFAPHLVFILSHLAAAPDSKVLFSPLNVVNLGIWDVPGHVTWNSMLVYKSLADVLYLIRDREDRRILFLKINLYEHFYKGPIANLDFKSIIKIIVLAKNDGEEHNMIAEYLSTAVFAFWAHSGSSQRFLIKCALVSLTIFVLHIPIVNNVIKFFIKNKQPKRIFYYNRYFLFNKDYRL